MRSPLTALSAALAGLVLAVGAMEPISNGDTFGHLAQGRAIAENGGPPALDPFSFWRPEPQPWVNYEWLSDWLSWELLQAFGWNGLVGAAMLITGGSALAMVLLCARVAGPVAAWLGSILLVVSLPALRFRLSARPHLLALPFAILYLALLTSERAFADRRSALRTTAILFAAHVLWANLHGSHLLGLAIAGASVLGALPDRARAARLAGVTGALLLASCISPWGPAMFADALLHVLDPAYRAAVSEWHSIAMFGVSWTTVHTALYCLALVAIAPSALRAGPRIRAWLAVAVLLAIAALRSLRFIEEMLMIGVPLVAIVIATKAGERLARAARAPLVAASAAGAVALAATGIVLIESERRVGAGLDLRFLPGDAAEHVEHELGEARVLGSLPTSWYLLFAAPSARVLVDGRVPFYGPEHVQAAADALTTPSVLWHLIERFGVDTVVVQHTSPDEAGAATALASDPRVVRSWIDGSYAVYVTRALAERRAIDPRRFDALPGAYEPAAILGADDARAAAIREDLANLGEGPDARALAAFVRAMLRLRPLAREAGWAGYRAPRDEAERAQAETALAELEATRGRVGRVPVLAAHATLVAALACRLDDARRLLDEARRDGEVRETIFAEAEIALRAGDAEAVRSFVAAARGVPGAAGDPWLAALERALSEGVRCPS